MNKIYFANKGCTVAAKCPNIFPNKDKYMYKASPELFADCDFLLYITPRMVDQSYFMAHFIIYDCTRPNFTTFGNEWRNNTPVVLGASLRERYLNVSTYSHPKEHMHRDIEYRELLSRSREASRLLEDGIALFNEYFPYQTYGGRKFYELPENQPNA
jgi:hypothetical protein